MNKLIEKGISHRMSKEELALDMYVYNTMLAFGYDIYSFDSDSEDKEYEKYANEAIKYLVQGKPIPQDIQEYLLRKKLERESSGQCSII